MGLLDTKQRIFDTVITSEGRKQMANGTFKPTYYSFSDANALYDYNDVFVSGSGNTKETHLATMFNFEASTNMPQDLITFEINDAGKLVSKEFSYPSGVLPTQFVDGRVFVSGSQQYPVDGFAAIANSIVSSTSLTNFQNLQIIGSPVVFDETQDQFIIAPLSTSFVVTDNKPIPSSANGGTQDVSIDNAESLFQDKRLSHVPNFDFLPPVNKPRIGSNETLPIGFYVPLSQRPILTWSQLFSEISQYEKQGYSEVINFTETSPESRIIAQFFEVAGEGVVSKLDVIDFGTFSLSSQEQVDTVDELVGTVTKHVFFAGKIFVDSNGSQTFVNMFTLIFE